MDSPADTLKQLYLSLVHPHLHGVCCTTVGPLHTEGHLQTGKCPKVHPKTDYTSMGQ